MARERQLAIIKIGHAVRRRGERRDRNDCFAALPAAKCLKLTDRVNSAKGVSDGVNP